MNAFDNLDLEQEVLKLRVIYTCWKTNRMNWVLNVLSLVDLLKNSTLDVEKSLDVQHGQ